MLNFTINIVLQTIIVILSWYYTNTRYICICESLPIMFQISKITGLLITFNICFLIILILCESKIYTTILKKYIPINIIVYSILHTIFYIYNFYKRVYIVNNIIYNKLELYLTGLIIACLLLGSIHYPQLISPLLSCVIIYHSFGTFSFYIILTFNMILFISIIYRCMFYYKIKSVIKHNEYNYEYIIYENSIELINTKIISVLPYNTFIPIKKNTNDYTYSIISNSCNYTIGSKLIFFRTIKRKVLKLNTEYTYIIIISDIYKLTKFIEVFKNVLNTNDKYNVYILFKLNMSSDLNFCIDIINQLDMKFFINIYVKFDDTKLFKCRIYNSEEHELFVYNFINSIRINQRVLNSNIKIL